MADSEFLLTVGGTDVADDIWNWSSLTLTDSWTQRATLTFTMRQEFGAELTVDPYADVLFVNRLTGQTLFSGFVAPAPIVQRWADPTWVETDVSCVAYDALLDLVVTGSAVAFGKSPIIGGDWTMGAARSRLEMLLRTGFGDSRVLPRITEAPAESVTIPGGGVVTVGDQLTWEAGTSLASIVNEVLQIIQATVPYFRRVLKWLPTRGLVMCDPSYAILGTAPVALTDDDGGRPAAISKTTDASALISGVVINDNGGYTGNDTAEPGVQAAITDMSGPTFSLAGTNGWQIIRNTITDSALGAAQAAALSQPVGSYPPGDVYSIAFSLYQQNVDPLVAPVRYDVTTGLLPDDLLVGQSVTFTWTPGTDVTATIQGIQTTFTDGVLDTVTADWPHYLDDGWALDDGNDLDAAVSASKPRRMRVHTLNLAGTTKTFLGSYAARTGR